MTHRKKRICLRLAVLLAAAALLYVFFARPARTATEVTDLYARTASLAVTETGPAGALFDTDPDRLKLVLQQEAGLGQPGSFSRRPTWNGAEEYVLDCGNGVQAGIRMENGKASLLYVLDWNDEVSDQAAALTDCLVRLAEDGRRAEYALQAMEAPGASDGIRYVAFGRTSIHYLVNTDRETGRLYHQFLIHPGSAA